MTRDQLIATVAEALNEKFHTRPSPYSHYTLIDPPPSVEVVARVAVEALNLTEEPEFSLVGMAVDAELHRTGRVRYVTPWQMQEPPGGEPEGSQA